MAKRTSTANSTDRTRRPSTIPVFTSEEVQAGIKARDQQELEAAAKAGYKPAIEELAKPPAAPETPDKRATRRVQAMVDNLNRKLRDS